MSGWQIVQVVEAVVFPVAIALTAWRAGHYIRTGRWFR